MDSGYYHAAVCQAVRRAGAYLPVTARLDPAVQAAIAAYTQHYFDSRGTARLYAMSFAEGTWELLRDSPDFSPLDFSQRFTGTFSDDGDAIRGTWEKSFRFARLQQRLGVRHPGPDLLAAVPV